MALANASHDFHAKFANSQQPAVETPAFVVMVSAAA
jgi:hypothetical protein